MKRKNGRSTATRHGLFYGGLARFPCLQCTAFLFFFSFKLALARTSSSIGKMASALSSRARRALGDDWRPGRGCVGVGDRGTQRDSRSVPKRRLDDVCAPKRQRGRTLKVSLRTDGFVPVLHLQGDVAMAVNALSGMEGVRARSPVGSSLLLSRNPPPSRRHLQSSSVHLRRRRLLRV